MKSFGFARAGVGPRALLAATLLLIGGRSFAEPKKGTKSPARPPSTGQSTQGKREVATPPPRPAETGLPEVADAFPSPARPTAPDLLLKPQDEHKADALAAFSKGLLAEDSADQERMIEGYRKALEFDPGYSELAVKLAYEYARRNDAPAGIQVLKDAIKASPKEAIPYVYLSQLYAKNLKKPDIAVKYAEQALALAPDNFTAYLAVHELYLAGGHAKKAEQLLERAGTSATRDPKYWAQLADYLKRLYLKEDGSCEPAQLERMNVAFRKAAELGKTDAVILTNTADYFVLSKQVKEAIPYYLAILNLKPEATDAPLNNVRDKLARSLLVTGQRDEAVRYLEQIIKDSPLRFETYELLGEIYEQKEEFDKALANYEHSLLLDASEPRNHLRIAELLMRAKRYERAVEIMQAARKRFKDVPYVTYSLAIALSQAKRHNEAMAAFSDAQAEASTSREEMLNAAFFFSFGAAAEQAGMYDRAAELLKQSIELEPSSAQACNYLGYMWADRGEHMDEATELIKKAVALDPDKGEYLDSLGWLYFKKGDAEAALKELLHAQESILREEKKDDATVLDHIGDAYAKLGKTAEALSYWQKSLSLTTEDQKAADKIAGKIEAAKQKVTRGEPAKIKSSEPAP